MKFVDFIRNFTHSPFAPISKTTSAKYFWKPTLPPLPHTHPLVKHSPYPFIPFSRRPATTSTPEIDIIAAYISGANAQVHQISVSLLFYSRSTMSGYSSSVKRNESAIVSDAESDVEVVPGRPIRRSSSLFSLSSNQEPLPKPDETEYVKFLEDNRHFSMIRNLHMADFITCLNGFSGFYSIISCLRYTLTGKTLYVQRAHFFILLGLFFDFFDGKVARLRNKSSLMGQELDSLADLVSFGVSPATIAFAIGFRSTLDVLVLTFWVLCGLTRLARFNVSTNNIPKDKTGKAKFFEGFPIPTNLAWVAYMAYLVWKDQILEKLPGGVLFEGTFAEVHVLVAGFFLQGCAQISKSLHIPKL